MTASLTHRDGFFLLVVLAILVPTLLAGARPRHPRSIDRRTRRSDTHRRHHE